MTQLDQDTTRNRRLYTETNRRKQGTGDPLRKQFEEKQWLMRAAMQSIFRQDFDTRVILTS